jgi:hypothetical protein
LWAAGTCIRRHSRCPHNAEPHNGYRELGAINLNLLGALVTTTPVTIDINGDTAGPVGALVCEILNTLNSVVGVVGLLNQLLGLVTGLLGGVVGGIGAPVAI